MIEVDNDGLLIPDDMKEKVFEPFVRLKGTEKQRGTGIGLALARSLTELHQGTLFIHTGDEKFNRFVLHLPVLHSRAGTVTRNVAGETTIPSTLT